MKLSLPVRRRHWVRLDNASNIFLAARSDVDTKVFRMAAELDERLADRRVPQAIEDFLRQPWAHHVTMTVLREGEEGEAAVHGHRRRGVRRDRADVRLRGRRAVGPTRGRRRPRGARPARTGTRRGRR